MDYDDLLEKAHKELPEDAGTGERFEAPTLDVFTEGNKTIIRNFSQVLQKIRRTPDHILKYFTKEFAVPAERLGDKAMFIGKRAPDDFTRLFQIYVKDYLECPTCKSPDTKIVKENRISFLICEACGAKSTLKGKYA